MAGFPTHPPRPLIGDSAIFLRAIGSQIRDQLALPWVPPLLRTPKVQRLQVGIPTSVWTCPLLAFFVISLIRLLSLSLVPHSGGTDSALPTGLCPPAVVPLQQVGSA